MYDRCVVITNPMIAANKSAEVTLSKFLRVISSVYTSISVIGGNVTIEKDLQSISVCSFDIDRSPKKTRRITDIIQLQIRMSKHIRTFVKKGDPVFFWVGDKMILPFWTLERRKADIRYFIYGNLSKEGSPSFFTKMSTKLISYMANRANSVYVESPGVLQEWQPLVRNKTVRELHLYTSIGEFTPIDKRKNTIGMLCRLTQGKHVLECIQAFAEMRKKYPEYTLEIIGSGRQETECKRMIKSLNADSYITMLGWVDHEHVIEKTCKWKYLLFASDTEGMPNSVLEMMGQGIPAIASPVGGIRDIIKDGENGWLLVDNSVESILKGLLRAIEYASEYRTLSIGAKKTIEMKYILETAQKNAMINC